MSDLPCAATGLQALPSAPGSDGRQERDGEGGEAGTERSAAGFARM